jgi:molecular chaperone DnaK
MPQIEVTFDIDANGILNVSAKDKGTGKEQKIRIEASSGLTDAEIERMRNEAKANEAADKAEKEKIEKLNQADGLIFQTERQLNEYGDKLSETNKTAISSAMEKLRTAHGAQDLAGVDAAMNELNTAWQAASGEMYNAAQQPQDAGAQQQNAGTDSQEQVTDVNFEEVK